MKKVVEPANSKEIQVRFKKVMESLPAVFDKYGYNYEEQKELKNLVYHYFLESIDAYRYLPDNYKVAKLLRILYQCKEVVVSGTIKYPQTDTDRKGHPVYTTICHGNTMNQLILFLNALLERDACGAYEREFNWEPKIRYDFPEETTKMIDCYTYKELDQILAYEKENGEKKRKENEALTENQKLGQWLFDLYMNMVHEGYFSGKSKEKTREYAFLHDCFVVIGCFDPPEFETMTNSEKYDVVRSRINSYIAHQINSRKTAEKIKKLIIS